MEVVGENHPMGSEPHAGWNRWRIGVEGVQARDTACMKVPGEEEAWDSTGLTGSRCGWDREGLATR